MKSSQLKKIIILILGSVLMQMNVVSAQNANKECLSQELAGEYYKITTKTPSFVNLKELGVSDSYTFNSNSPDEYRFVKNNKNQDVRYSNEVLYETETESHDEKGNIKGKKMNFLCYFVKEGLSGLAARNVAPRNLSNPAIVNNSNGVVYLRFDTEVAGQPANYVCKVFYNNDVSSSEVIASDIKVSDIIAGFNKTPVLATDNKFCIRVQETNLNKQNKNYKRGPLPESSASEGTAVL